MGAFLGMWLTTILVRIGSYWADLAFRIGLLSLFLLGVFVIIDQGKLLSSLRGAIKENFGEPFRTDEEEKLN